MIRINLERTTEREMLEANRAYYRNWRRLNPEWSRDRRLRKHYGITAAQYDALLGEQAGRCALCLLTPPDGRRLAVDHDHQNGRIRGLLCLQCNISLGKLGDTVSSIERVLVYLKGSDQ